MCGECRHVAPASVGAALPTDARTAASNVHVEAKVEVASGLASVDAPVLGGALPKSDRDVVPRDAEHREAVDDLAVQIPFGLHRSARETVDRHEGEELGLRQPRWAGEPMRLMGDKPDVLVLRWDQESSHERAVHRIDDRHLLRFGVPATNLNEGTGHSAIVPSKDGRTRLNIRDDCGADPANRAIT
jgi:hypothetical protein